MATGTATTFAPVNVSGVLFSKSDVRTPLFNRIPTEVTSSLEYVMGAEYEHRDPAQPAISENDSLIAPDPTFIERTQAKNVCQTFHESVAVSYMKQANTDALTGLNLANATNNVPNELQWQLARKIEDMRHDMEFTIINGEYSLATNAGEVNKTRGLIEGIGTNVLDAAGDELNAESLDLLAKMVAENSPMGLAGTALVLNPVQILQLNNILKQESNRLSATAGGTDFRQYLTAFGVLNVFEAGHRLVPNGTGLLVNFTVLKNRIAQPFMVEPLARVGMSDRYQISGQWGLDYGVEFAHAKIENLATEYVPAKGLKVFVTNYEAEPTVS